MCAAQTRALVHTDALEEFLATAEGGRAVESYTELKTVLLPFTDEMM